MPFAIKGPAQLVQIIDRFGLGPTVPFVDPRGALTSGPLNDRSFALWSFARLMDGVWDHVDGTNRNTSHFGRWTIPESHKNPMYDVSTNITKEYRYLRVATDQGRTSIQITRPATDGEQARPVRVEPGRASFAKFMGTQALRTYEDSLWEELPEGGKWRVQIHREHRYLSCDQDLLLGQEGASLTMDLVISLQGIATLIDRLPPPRHFLLEQSFRDKIDDPDYLVEESPRLALWLAAFLREQLGERAFRGKGEMRFPPLGLLVKDREISRAPDRYTVSLEGATLVYPVELTEESHFRLTLGPGVRIEQLPPVEEGDELEDLNVTFTGTPDQRALSAVMALTRAAYSYLPI